MSNVKIFNTTPSVMAMKDFDFLDTVLTPQIWYKKIKTKAGGADFLAITLLSDIVYWHRLRPYYDNDTLIGYTKKFHSDKLQKQTTDLAEIFCVTPKAINAALNRLVEMQLITREFRDVKVGKVLYQNRQFIDIIPKNIIKISQVQEDKNKPKPNTFGLDHPKPKVLTPNTKGLDTLNPNDPYTKTTNTKTTNTKNIYKEEEHSEKESTPIKKAEPINQFVEEEEETLFSWQQIGEERSVLIQKHFEVFKLRGTPLTNYSDARQISYMLMSKEIEADYPVMLEYYHKLRTENLQDWSYSLFKWLSEGWKSCDWKKVYLDLSSKKVVKEKELEEKSKKFGFKDTSTPTSISLPKKPVNGFSIPK